MYSTLRFIPDMFYKHRPVHLTLFVTRRCNARCPFCFYLEKEGDTREGREMSIDEYTELSQSMGSLLWLAFSGGEIFLRDDLPEICSVFYQNNKPSIILLPTNGLMPERTLTMAESVLRTCSKSVVAVKVSLDGPATVHDAMRGVPGSFDKAVQTLRTLEPLLKKYPNFELGVNTVFSSENQDNMDEIIDFVKTLPMVKTQTVSLVRGDITDKTYQNVDISKYLDASERLAEGMRDGSGAHYRFRGARLKAAQDVVQRRLIYQTASSGRQQLPCYTGILNLVVTETGDLYPCETFRDEFLMGNVRDADYDVQALIKSDRGQQVVDRIRTSCSCTHECYMMTNILFNLRFWPSILREASQIGQG